MDTPNKQSIGSDKTRDFLEKLIDEYKYGELSAEDISDTVIITGASRRGY
ncbi:MAG: hypothetical protein IKG25_10325 [Mogibacterium sp.]|nr:hypothetical protein [Mogibacterium sp.]